MAYHAGVIWYRLRLTTQLRVVFAVLAVAFAALTVYVWTDRSTATDWVWFYRFAAPIAGVPFVWAVWRPRIIGVSRLFIPFAILAVVRVVDFWQDWFLTPEPDQVVNGMTIPGEPVDLLTRLTLAPFGWVIGLVLVVLVEMYERLATARVHVTSGTVSVTATTVEIDRPSQ